MNVDITNFGQVAACCGMLDVASDISCGATGHFVPTMTDVWKFNLSIPGDIDPVSSVFDRVKKLKPVEVKYDASQNPFPANHPISAYLAGRPNLGFQGKGATPAFDKLSPIGFMDGDRPFERILDWWIDEKMSKGRLAMWCGQSQGGDVYVSALKQAKSPTFDLCKSEKTFYFDSRCGMDALSLGYSADKSNTEKLSSPFLEVMAAWGCQRFRPLISGLVTDGTISYSPWIKPLKATVASVAFSGLLENLGLYKFKFAARVLPRGHDYYRIGQATPIA